MHHTAVPCLLYTSSKALPVAVCFPFPWCLANVIGVVGGEEGKDRREIKHLSICNILYLLDNKYEKQGGILIS